MRLVDLEPNFIRYKREIHRGKFVRDGADPLNYTEADLEERDHEVNLRVYVDRLEDAQGVQFLCPVCFRDNGGPVGTHMVEVTFAGRGVADEDGMHNDKGAPVRWQVTGSGFADLTTKPSVLLLGGCNWHGFITNGEVSII